MKKPRINVNWIHRCNFIDGVVGILGVLFLFLPLAEASAQEIHGRDIARIGVVAQVEKQDCLERWRLTSEYLSEEIPSHEFVVVPLSPTEIVRVYEAGELHFSVADPVISAELIYLRRGRKIATLKNRGPDGSTTPRCGGVVFCRMDNRLISEAADLNDKSFAAVDQKSLGGWLAAARELREIGIGAGDFAVVDFLGSHEAVVQAVLDGSHQAGTVQTDILERLAADGEIGLDQLRIIKLHEGDGGVDFPFKISTKLYPERSVLAATHTSEDLADRVSAALLSMPENSASARAIGSAGWTLPAKYRPVLECLIDLDVEPYGRLFKPSVRQPFKMFPPWIVGAAAVLMIGIAASFVGGRRSRELRRVRTELKTELDRRLSSDVALKANESRYRLVVGNAPDPIFSIDENGLIEEVNEAFLLEGKYRREDVIGTEHGSRVHPEDRAVLHAASNSVFGGETSRYEVRVRNSQGDYRWYSIVIWPIFGEENEVVGAQGIARDVDQRRKDEMQLRQLSAAIEQAPVAVVITNIYGTIEYVNPACVEITGYSLDEILGKNPSILNSGKLPKSYFEEMWATITSGSVWRGEFRNRRKDGEEYWERAVIAPVRNDQGNIVRYVAVKEDLTELRETVRALQDSEMLFQTLIETAQDSIFVKDRDLKYRLVNPAMAADLDRSPEEIKGLTDLDLFGPDEAREIQMIDARVLRGETTEIVSSSTVTGEPRSFSVSRVPLRDKDGEIIGVCGIARDITEQELQKEELQEATDAAEAATEAKSLFTANISHELRTPLNGLVGMIDLLRQTDLDSEQEQYVGIADTSAQSLTELIGDVLDFSRIEAGKVELRPENFGLRSWLEETIRIVSERAKSKELDLDWFAAPSVPDLIRADQYRLQQVMLNLIWNAIKFTEKGSISVGVEFSSMKSGECSLEFSVQDTGAGIAKSKLESIFDVFALADESSTRSVGGTGLGLTISRNLVEKMGGRIWAESEPGKGSTFRFTLPQRPGFRGAADAGAESAMPKDPDKVLRVLVVDDNPVNRLVAVRTVEKGGHAVVEAVDGQEALNILAEEEPFDVVLMDLHMPMIDGLGATKEIRRIEGEDRRLWIIGLTAAATVGDKEACLAAGMDDYLSKPVRFVDLQKALSRAVVRQPSDTSGS